MKKYILLLKNDSEALDLGETRTCSDVPKIGEKFDYSVSQKEFNKQIRGKFYYYGKDNNITFRQLHYPKKDEFHNNLYDCFGNKTYIIEDVKHLSHKRRRGLSDLIKSLSFTGIDSISQNSISQVVAVPKE